MASCPACGRSVAREGERCLYCGAALGAAALPSRPPAPADADARKGDESPRRLVLLDLRRCEASTLAAALRISPYEASLLVRRGGLHLVRAGTAAEADAEAERLGALGAPALAVPEAEVRAAPLLCVAGERHGDGLRLRSTEGRVDLARGESLLVVSGPITREHLATDERRKMLTARLEDGFRFHLHRRSELRPLELDAQNFEVDFAPSGSARLELESWLADVAEGAPRDTAFARLTPVLAPTEPEAAAGALAAASSLASSARADGKPRVLLDNLAQFRVYSGCLAAALRRQ
jgi:hypothetical protein